MTDKWNAYNPREQYNPAIGSNVPVPDDPDARPLDTYADLNGLKQLLELLLSETRELEEELEEDMLSFSMPVTGADPKLQEAHQKEWPSRLGKPGDQVSYRYYKALRLRDTTSALYLRKRYEEAARGVTGTNSIDILTVTALIKDEALLIREFINAYIHQVDDSSEFRVLELFQDWVESALVSVRQFWEFFETGKTTTEPLPADEVAGITPEEARRGQAVFKVKLNSYNSMISQDLEYVHKNFSEFAPVFYKKFLGPALNYRLNIGRREIPSNTMISREIEQASRTLDTNLRSALADQSRRTKLFTSKVSKVRKDMAERDKYRSYIKQLSAKGTPLPKSAAYVMVNTQESSREIEFWDAEQRIAAARNSISPDASGTFYAPHGVLDDLGENHHDQYLLRDGGNEIVGDIEMALGPGGQASDGALIDGMRPSTHKHTGSDGTLQVEGTDIKNNTLRDEVVDVDAKPDPPTGLKVINYRANLDSPMIEATIAWQGSNMYTYEVQVAVAELQSGYANPSGA